MFYLCWMWGNNISTSKVTQCGLVSVLYFVRMQPSVCVCVHMCVCLCVWMKLDGGMRGREGWSVCTCSILLSGFSSSGIKRTSSLSKPYPPSWPGIMYTHYSTIKDYISIHTKMITMLQCRLQHNRKSSADYTHTHTHTLQTYINTTRLHTPPCSGCYLFPVVLRHHSDSSAVDFTVTVFYSVFTNTVHLVSATYDHLKECLKHCLLSFCLKIAPSSELPLRCMNHTHTHTSHTSKSVHIAMRQRCLQHEEWNAFVRTIHPTHQHQNYHGRSDWIRPCVTPDLLLTWCDSCCLFGVLFAVGETEDTIICRDTLEVVCFFVLFF